MQLMLLICCNTTPACEENSKPYKHCILPIDRVYSLLCRGFFDEKTIRKRIIVCIFSDDIRK